MLQPNSHQLGKEIIQQHKRGLFSILNYILEISRSFLIITDISALLKPI